MPQSPMSWIAGVPKDRLDHSTIDYNSSNARYNPQALDKQSSVIEISDQEKEGNATELEKEVESKAAGEGSHQVNEEPTSVSAGKSPQPKYAPRATKEAEDQQDKVLNKLLAEYTTLFDTPQIPARGGGEDPLDHGS